MDKTCKKNKSDKKRVNPQYNVENKKHVRQSPAEYVDKSIEYLYNTVYL